MTRVLRSQRILIPGLKLSLLVAVQYVELKCDCWPHLFYWLDIIQLSLQQSGGQPGAAAVAAAQELMKEKHSIFLSRYVYCRRHATCKRW
jgi:hypothetical protein